MGAGVTLRAEETSEGSSNIAKRPGSDVWDIPNITRLPQEAISHDRTWDGEEKQAECFYLQRFWLEFTFLMAL